MTPIALLILVVMPLAFTASVFGCVAVLQIRRSQGRLYGLELAVFDALLFPLLVVNGLMYRLLIPTSNLNGVVIACVIADIFLIRWVWRAVNKGSAGDPSGNIQNQPGEAANQSGAARAGDESSARARTTAREARALPRTSLYKFAYVTTLTAWGFYVVSQVIAIISVLKSSLNIQYSFICLWFLNLLVVTAAAILLANFASRKQRYTTLVFSTLLSACMVCHCIHDSWSWIFAPLLHDFRVFARFFASDNVFGGIAALSLLGCTAAFSLSTLFWWLCCTHHVKSEVDASSNQDTKPYGDGILALGILSLLLVQRHFLVSVPQTLPFILRSFTAILGLLLSRRFRPLSFTAVAGCVLFWFNLASMALSVVFFFEQPAVNATEHQAKPAKSDLQKAEITPTTVSEPPKLRYLAWLDEVQKNPHWQAWQPNGEFVKQEDLHLPPDLATPGSVSANVHETEAAKASPRFLCIWISHPAFDGQGVAKIKLLDEAGKPLETPTEDGCTSVSSPNKDSQNLGWITASICAGSMGKIPPMATLQLSYSTGPWQHCDEIPVDFHGIKALRSGVLVTGPGQEAQGITFIELRRDHTQDPENEQFNFVAVMKDGRRCDSGVRTEGGSIDLERNETERFVRIERFVFNAPLDQVKNIDCRKRPINTMSWTIPLQAASTPIRDADPKTALNFYEELSRDDLTLKKLVKEKDGPGATALIDTMKPKIEKIMTLLTGTELEQRTRVMVNMFLPVRAAIERNDWDGVMKISSDHSDQTYESDLRQLADDANKSRLNGASFGPVIECVVTGAIDFDSGKLIEIDSNTGRFAGMPESVDKSSDLGEDLLDDFAWMEHEGIDAVLVRDRRFDGLGMKVEVLNKEAWQNMTAEQLSHTLESSGSKVHQSLNPGENASATYAFQTREGGMGLLQITGFTDNPSGVKIRYKLSRNAAALPSVSSKTQIANIENQIVINLRPDGTCSVAKEHFNLAALTVKLAEIASLDTKSAIIIRATANTDTQYVVNVIDACKSAGLANIAFATPTNEPTLAEIPPAPTPTAVTAATLAVTAELKFLSVPIELPLDLGKLNLNSDAFDVLSRHSGVELLSAPSVTVASGRQCEIEVLSGSATDAFAPTPTGVSARLRPTLEGETVHYAVKLSVRSRQPSGKEGGERTAIQEFTHSGDAALHKPVVFDVGTGDNSKRLLAWMIFHRGEKATSQASPTPTPAVDATHPAVTAAQTWLAAIDAGNYSQSWKEASPFFKAAVSEQSWNASMESFRKPLGDLVSRKLKSAQSCQSLPGAPDGEYVVMQFDTSFAAKKTAVESVTFSLEKDGLWRAAGYFIK